MFESKWVRLSGIPKTPNTKGFHRGFQKTSGQSQPERLTKCPEREADPFKIARDLASPGPVPPKQTEKTTIIIIRGLSGPIFPATETASPQQQQNNIMIWDTHPENDNTHRMVNQLARWGKESATQNIQANACRGGGAM